MTALAIVAVLEMLVIAGLLFGGLRFFARYVNRQEKRDVARDLELRNERREWANRLQHPHLVPTGTRPVRSDLREQATQQRAAVAREMAQVGRVAPEREDTLEGVP